MAQMIQNLLLSFFLLSLACAAQSLSPDVTRRIDHQMRVSYNIPPEVEIVISSVVPSTEVPGYDAITVNISSAEKQKQYEFLLSKDRNTLVRLAKFDLSKDAFAEIMNKIDITGRPVRGTRSARVTVVGFDDFECPFCARLHQTLFPELLKDYGDRVAFIYKDYPVAEIHPWAIHAAVDANCLAAQSGDAYWDFADSLHANKQEVDAEKLPGARFDLIDKLTLQQGQKHSLNATKLQACVKAQDETVVRSEMKEAESLGVNATPALFINGQRIDGAVPESRLRAALDAALKDASQSAALRATPSTASR